VKQSDYQRICLISLSRCRQNVDDDRISLGSSALPLVKTPQGGMRGSAEVSNAVKKADPDFVPRTNRSSVPIS
jgi:hypothetical protein